MPHLLPLQYFLDSGAVNASGSIEFYLAGGSTASNLAYPTYDDAVAGTNTLGTSEALNSAGRPDNSGKQIWLTDIAMKIVIKDSDGTTLVTVDDIYGAGAGQVMNINSSDQIDITILKDNNATALTILEGSNNYINFDTRDSQELISFGNATQNTSFEFLGTGAVTFNGTAFFPDDKFLRFGNTNADPDAYMEWDTATTPDQFTIRVDNNGALGLQTLSGSIVCKPSETTVLTITSTEATFAKPVITPATATGAAGLNVPHGTAPSSPTNGDMWTTTSGLYVRINGVTKTVTLT